MTKNKELPIIEQRKKEEEKLWIALSELSEDRKKMLKETVKDAAFKVVRLRILQSKIDEEGDVEEYQNGANQSGRKPSSYVQVYNNYDKSYQSQIKILLDALPKDAPKENDDGFNSFVNNR